MHSFTVVLTVPHFLADPYGQDHYTARVVLTADPVSIADAVLDAIDAARREAMAAYAERAADADDWYDDESWYVVAVFAGLLDNLDSPR